MSTRCSSDSTRLRRLRRAVAIVPTLMMVASLALVVFWLAVQIVNDQYRISQYAFWVPSVTLLMPAAALWISASVLRALGRCRRARLDWLAGIGCAMLALHVAFVDYRLHNIVVGPSARASAPSIRVLNWNASGVHQFGQVLDPILAQSADLVITVDAYVHREWSEAASTLGPGAAVLYSHNLKMMSRFSVLRHAAVDLGIPAPEPLIEQEQEDRRIMRLLGRLPLLRHAAPPDGLRPRPDPGRAWYIELDTTEPLGRPIVVWVIDMPSDLRLGRRAIAARSLQTINTWRGLESVVLPDGVVAQRTSTGFPAPDLIMGDFNIPRRSASLRPLTQNYPHAHAQAGRGHSGTYPRHRPMVHIDHFFIGPTLRALSYEIIDPGTGSHRMQVVDVEVRPTGAK